MGVYLCINREAHTIDHGHHNMKNLNDFSKETMKTYWDVEYKNNTLENIKNC